MAHGHLVGSAEGTGVKRAAKAAVYPKNFCDAIIKDICRLTHNGVFWGCEKCRLGAKSDKEHTRIAGNCKMAGAVPRAGAKAKAGATDHGEGAHGRRLT